MKYFIEFSVAALTAASVSLLMDYSPINGAFYGICGLTGWYLPDLIKKIK